MRRVGVIGIVIQGSRDVSIPLQKLLNEYGNIIMGRMGVPDRKHNISAISLIVAGTNEEISALTGKLGRLPDINIKSAVTTVEVED